MFPRSANLEVCFSYLLCIKNYFQRQITSRIERVLNTLFIFTNQYHARNQHSKCDCRQHCADTICICNEHCRINNRTKGLFITTFM